MPLQAFFDESGNAPDQTLMSLGGLLATARKWELFADRWNALCRKGPSVEFVKYTEIVRRDGQFKGFSEAERDARLAEMVDVIIDCCRAVMWVTIRHDHFQKYVQSVSTPFRNLLNDAPQLILIGRSVVPTIKLLNDLKLRDRCDFYFDELDGCETWVQELWPKMRSTDWIPPHLIKKGAKPFIGKARFESDDEFLPLQAADLIAGWRRDVAIGKPTLPVFDRITDSLKYESFEISEERLARLGKKLEESALQAIERFGAIPLYGYDKSTAATTRKRLERWRQNEIKKRGS